MNRLWGESRVWGGGGEGGGTRGVCVCVRACVCVCRLVATSRVVSGERWGQWGQDQGAVGRGEGGGRCCNVGGQRRERERGTAQESPWRGPLHCTGRQPAAGSGRPAGWGCRARSSLATMPMVGVRAAARQLFGRVGTAGWGRERWWATWAVGEGWKRRGEERSRAGKADADQALRRLGLARVGCCFGGVICAPQQEKLQATTARVAGRPTHQLPSLPRGMPQAVVRAPRPPSPPPSLTRPPQGDERPRPRCSREKHGRGSPA